jgi:hypothetical protein
MSQFFYALAVANSSSMTNTLTTGAPGAAGDLYCGGNLLLSNKATINGDTEAVGSLTPNGAAITGAQSSHLHSIPLPSPVSSNYWGVASATMLNIFGNSLSGYTFTRPYSVLYCDGDTTIHGTFSGKGIVFVHGDVYTDNSMSYSQASDELAIIVTGDVIVNNPSHTNLVGYWDCGGTFNASYGGTVTRGCVVANAFSSSSNGFTVTYDQTIWNTLGEPKRMKLPGFWP